MLVLTRFPGETIRIGDDIIITVVELRGDRVRVGIDAPKEIPVHRSEIYDSIHRKDLSKKVDQALSEKFDSSIDTNKPVSWEKITKEEVKKWKQSI